MPQMAPMSWVLLFIFFSIMLLVINVNNYYLFSPLLKTSVSSKSISLKTSNWKW
uniref:ATP synthase complex subunit 8 n=1 Tax=Pantala flavescens TaxID=185825 RepID=A0A7T3USP5_PANFL|nr:ATP synthase F0 subunit 8 [Pantala flavescens]QPQ74963.1 ATP synthase F0 subunit 8 [Pantala flavescens]QPZ75904.1 ATP synthase F0 subunit 8 [Pantala flavescens]UPX00823.1 ATP synthase F0 subunit 8 [Pantala flavescens]